MRGECKKCAETIDMFLKRAVSRPSNLFDVEVLVFGADCPLCRFRGTNHEGNKSIFIQIERDPFKALQPPQRVPRRRRPPSWTISGYKTP